MSKTFVLDTDVSGYGVGTVLSQSSDGEEAVIAYYSKCLSKSHPQYCVTRKELLVIILSIKHFYHYLNVNGTEF